MKILVCVKQVPDAEARIRINDTGSWFEAEMETDYKLNPFDEYAVEEALLIKEAVPDTTVAAVSVGPERAGMAVKRAMGMGADRGIHVMARESGARDSLWVSAAIAEIARQENPGLIFTGVMARDDMQGLVGPMIAEMLDWPCATSTILEVLDRDQGTIYVEREIEGGYRHCLELSLPAVLTIQTGINQPRYPSLSNIMRAKKQELEVIRSASPDLPHSREAVLRVSHPQKTRDALVLEGDQTEKAVRLLGMLREKSLI